MNIEEAKEVRSLLDELENLDKFLAKTKWRDKEEVKMVFSAQTHLEAEKESREPIYFSSTMIAIIRKEALYRRNDVQEQLDNIQ